MELAHIAAAADPEFLAAAVLAELAVAVVAAVGKPKSANREFFKEFSKKHREINRCF